MLLVHDYCKNPLPLIPYKSMLDSLFVCHAHTHIQQYAAPNLIFSHLIPLSLLNLRIRDEEHHSMMQGEHVEVYHSSSSLVPKSRDNGLKNGTKEKNERGCELKQDAPLFVI